MTPPWHSLSRASPHTHRRTQRAGRLHQLKLYFMVICLVSGFGVAVFLWLQALFSTQRRPLLLVTAAEHTMQCVFWVFFCSSFFSTDVPQHLQKLTSQIHFFVKVFGRAVRSSQNRNIWLWRTLGVCAVKRQSSGKKSLSMAAGARVVRDVPMYRVSTVHTDYRLLSVIVLNTYPLYCTESGWVSLKFFF